MVGQIYHVGLTVADMEKTLKFYRDILGLRVQGEILMQGKETDAMFRKPNCKARVVYLNGSEEISAPPVELIQFVGNDVEQTPGDLFRTSISELCFYTDDAQKVYEHLLSHNVECLSAPQEFDFREYGMGKSKAFYFKDPDGIILEIMEPVKEK